MAGYLERVAGGSLSRRGFVRASAVAAATLAAAGGLSACANTVQEAGTEQGVAEEKWVPVACWHGCSTRMCVNKALVKDGVVIRQKSDDTHEDTVERPQHRGCLRGRSQRKQVFGADRLKYPMKRKHWEPLTGGDKSLRGKDEWERITWDEALDYVAAELKNVIERYGNAAILGDGEVAGFLNRIGGFTSMWGTHSFGAYSIPVLYNGYRHLGREGGNDRMDLQNSETVVMFGCNPAWSACGIHSYYYSLLKREGVKFIGIDPLCNDSYAFFDAEWVPVRPGQDDALILGVAHTLLTEDDPDANPLVDWDFLDRCTIGFDADHMPEGADPKGNFKDYVLGTYDGVPKTPEWASKRCGTPVEQIRSLAYELRPSKKVAILTSWGPSRVNNGDCVPQFFMTLGAMTGHMGKPGHMCGLSNDGGAADGGPRLFAVGSNGNPSVEEPVDDCICSAELWNAVLTGSYTFNGRMTNYGFKNIQVPGETRTCDIHLIYNSKRAMLNSREDIMKGVEAFRKVDFVVTHAYVPNAMAMYSDIVLPICTPWEGVGRIAADGSRDAVVFQQPVCAPLFESRSDQEIVRGLMKRFDIPEEELFCGSEKQQLFNQICGATVVGEDGKTPETLVAITQEDIDAWGVEGAPQEGKYPLAQLWDDGICIVARKAGDNYGYVAYQDFVSDPENNPLPNSESGKFEIYCQKASEVISSMGYGDVPPIPQYVAKADGFEAAFSDFEGGVKGEYPYQMFNPRSLRSIMNSLVNVPQLQEAISNPVFMNAADAANEGLESGDAARFTSPHGSVIRTVQATNRIMPGVIAIPHTGWLEYSEEHGADMGGATNVLTGAAPTGQGTSGYNSAVVKVEKFAGDVVSDVEKPQIIIFEDGE